MKGDTEAINYIAAQVGPDAVLVIRHYLYLPQGDAAVAVAKELESRDYRTEVGPGADGINWLVQAHHEVVLTEQLITTIRRAMETLVAKFDGEYDGWEAEIRSEQTRYH